RIPPVFVTREEPFSTHAFGTQLTPIPIVRCSAFAANHQIAGFIRRQISSRLVDDADFVARHRLARASRLYLSRPRRKIDMEYLGRTDTIQNFCTEPFFPPAKNIAGQWFGRRNS